MKGGIACAWRPCPTISTPATAQPKGSISFLITGDEEGPAVNGTVKLLEWAEERGERFDHCILGEPTNTQRPRRHDQDRPARIALRRAGRHRHDRAMSPIRISPTIRSAGWSIYARADGRPLERRHRRLRASNLEFTTVDVGNPTDNVIPGEARARFNIRFNDIHSHPSLKTLIEQRLTAAASGDIHWRIDWEKSNADAFLTAPGPFVDMVTGAITEITGHTPRLSTGGGTSDARFIKNYCPVIEFGLVGQTMHQIDEHTTVGDLAILTAIYRRILDRYFG